MHILNNLAICSSTFFLSVLPLGTTIMLLVDKQCTARDYNGVMLYCCLVVLSYWCTVVRMYCCILVLVCIVIHDNLSVRHQGTFDTMLLQYRSNFFVRHRENSKQQLLMKIQKKKLLQMKEFSNILINLEEPIGYPAHTGLISLSVCLFVRPSEMWKNIHFECRN